MQYRCHGSENTARSRDVCSLPGYWRARGTEAFRNVFKASPHFQKHSFTAHFTSSGQLQLQYFVHGVESMSISLFSFPSLGKKYQMFSIIHVSPSQMTCWSHNRLISKYLPHQKLNPDYFKWKRIESSILPSNRCERVMMRCLRTAALHVVSWRLIIRRYWSSFLQSSLHYAPGYSVCHFRVWPTTSQGYKCSSWYTLGSKGSGGSWTHIFLFIAFQNLVRPLEMRDRGHNEPCQRGRYTNVRWADITEKHSGWGSWKETSLFKGFRHPTYRVLRETSVLYICGERGDSVLVKRITEH